MDACIQHATKRSNLDDSSYREESSKITNTKAGTYVCFFSYKNVGGE